MPARTQAPGRPPVCARHVGSAVSSTDMREHLAGSDHYQVNLSRTLHTIEGLEALHDALHAADLERPRLETPDLPPAHG